MNIKLACALTLVLAANAAFAGTDATTSAARPTDASLHHMLDVMQAHKLVDSMREQTDAIFTGYMNKLLEGKSLNARQTEIMGKSRARMVETLTGMLSWDVMEPVFLKVYAETFTQKEIDAMTAFYSSPTGHSVIEKMPLVMQNSMVAMKKQMDSVLPRIQQIAKETADEIKAEAAGEEKGKSG